MLNAIASSAAAAILTDTAPPWSSLRARAAATPTGARIQAERTLQRDGGGPPHVSTRLRLFDQPESAARVTLYRDDAAWCPYCQKTWLALEELRIPHRVSTVPLNAYGYKPVWFSRLVDGGKLPAIELDGALHVESDEIIRLLDATFADHGARAFVPAPGTDAAQRAEELLALLEALIAAWFSLVFYPVEGAKLDAARDDLHDALRRVDAELAAGQIDDSPWFLGGAEPSIVDVQYIVSVERLLASVLYWKGLQLRCTGEYAHFERWLAAFEARPSYIATKSDYYTHSQALPSQNGPGYAVPEAAAVAARIGGLGGAWSLDALSKHDDDVDEPLSPLQTAGGADAARHEAALCLATNHENVVRFAARGGSEPGNPSFHAELADPNAVPNEELLAPVDLALRHVTAKLLDGDVDGWSEGSAALDLAGSVDRNAPLMEGWGEYDDEDGGPLYFYNDETGEVRYSAPTGQLDGCLAYLRDRVGVPRDMGAAAAMWLRATLNWAVDVARSEPGQES